MYFNEFLLEESFKTLFQNEGYICNLGEEIKSRTIKEVIIKDDLVSYLKSKYPVLNDDEINLIVNNIENISDDTLYDVNKKFNGYLTEGMLFKRINHDDKDLMIDLIDFNDLNSNIFRFVNQVEIKGYEFRIPDGVIFVNGLPLVVLEFKSAIREEATIYDAYEQLTIRYARDIPDLFKYNSFVVISDGVNNKYGSLFADYDYYYSWRRQDDDFEEVDGIDSAFSMVMGLFKKERFINIVKNFIYFPDKANTETKMVSRYSQYFAATKLHDSIKKNMKPRGNGKGGTYFGATGCGKSLTMLFLTRLLMRDIDLKNPTILLITDRTDLDKQLSELFINSKKFIGDDNVVTIKSREDLKEKLYKNESGSVYLTTIQKFTEELDLLSDRSNIICISDEAHRTQINLDSKQVITDKGVKKKYGFAKFLHDSLPNATYVGFTGTPVDKTLDVFGPVVDKYTMKESIEDGVTVNLIYNGRAADISLNQIKVNDIEEYYQKCEYEGANEYQIEASKKEVAKMNSLIGDEDRLKQIAKDFINLYETRVEENATVKGKALFVCATRPIAYKFYKIILELRPEWGELAYSDEDITDDEKRLLKEMPKIKMVMTRNQDDDKEMYELLGTDNDRDEAARQFKNEKSNFKIAIVRDKWLTGFDVPCLDTIFIDKPIKEHNLIQTISRVNRTYEGKEKGLIVDYIGIKKYMNQALGKYTNFDSEEFEEVEEAVKLVKNELNVLHNMFYNFNDELFFNGTPLEKLECLNNAVEYIQATEDLEKRFMQSVKRLKSAYNLCINHKDISYKEKEYIHFYTGIKAVLFKLTKGEAPDIHQMNRVAMQLMEQAIESTGVEEVVNIEGNIQNIDILSDDYLDRIMKIKQPNTRIKILERLLKQTLKEYSKTNKIKALSFTERLNNLLDEYNNRIDDKKLVESVIDDVMGGLIDLMKDIEKDKESYKEKNIDFEEKAFYDILDLIAKKHGFEYPEEKLIALAREVKKLVSDVTKYVDWDIRKDINAQFKVDLILLLGKNKYPPQLNNEVFDEVFEQAKNFRRNM